MFNQLKKFGKQVKTLSSVPEGMEPWLLAELANKTNEDILYIAPDGVGLEQTAQILEYIMPEAEVLRFPAWDTVPYDRVSPNAALVAQRVDVLAQLSLFPDAKKTRFIITSVGAVLQNCHRRKFL